MTDIDMSSDPLATNRFTRKITRLYDEPRVHGAPTHDWWVYEHVPSYRPIAFGWAESEEQTKLLSGECLEGVKRSYVGNGPAYSVITILKGSETHARWVECQFAACRLSLASVRNGGHVLWIDSNGTGKAVTCGECKAVLSRLKVAQGQSN